MPITLETHAEWAAKHGGDGVQVDNRIIFGDGAQGNLEGTVRQEPPEDLSARLDIQRRRMKELMRRAEVEFSRTKAELFDRCSQANMYPNLPYPGPEAVAHLEHLKSAVLERRSELAEIEKAIAATPQGKAREERAENHRKRQARISAVHQRIGAVSLDGLPAREPDAAIREAAARESHLLGDALSRAAGIKPRKED